MSDGEIDLRQVTRFFLGIFLPLTWIYHGPAVLRFASVTTLGGLVAASVLATCVLALFLWIALVACTRLLCLILPQPLRGTAALVVLATFLTVLLAIGTAAWLSDYGVQVPRTIGVPVFCLAVIALTARRPALVRNSIFTVIENAWQLMRIPIYATTLVGAGLTVVALFARQAAPAFSATGVDVPSDSTTAGSARRPSIVLITMDAFSATRSSLYGASQSTTPALDEFAQHATVFDQAIAATNFTASAVISMQTGEYPWTHRVLEHQGYLQSPPPTLAYSLRRAGYRTAYFDANWLADPRHTRSAAGWDFASGPYQAIPVPRDRSLCALPICDTARLATVPPFEEVAAVYGFVVRRLGLLERVPYPPDPVFSDARSWIISHSGSGPLFVWIHVFPPHNPYLPPKPFLYSLLPARTLDTANELMSRPLNLFAVQERMEVHDLELRYKESLRYVDDRLGRFLRDPQLAEFLRGSVVVITSDHGESFERNFVGHTGPLLTQSLIHIPLLIRTPGMTAMRRIEAPVSETDVMPTVLDLANLPIPQSVDGLSLKPVLEGAPAVSRVIYAMNFERAYAQRPLLRQPHTVAVVDWPWKYVEYQGVPGLSAELYDLARDPAETMNLAAAERQRVQHYSALAQGAIAQSDARQ